MGAKIDILRPLRCHFPFWRPPKKTLLGGDSCPFCPPAITLLFGVKVNAESYTKLKVLYSVLKLITLKNTETGV